MGAKENFSLAENAEFKIRVNSLARRVAQLVLGESPSEEVVENNLILRSRAMVDKRAAFAKAITKDRKREIEYDICMNVTADGALYSKLTAIPEDNYPVVDLTGLTDADIEYKITEAFDDLSGVAYSDKGTSFYYIQTMALHSRAADMTLEMLRDAGVINVIKTNESGYRTAVNNTNYINTLAELQTIIDNVNNP